VLELADGKAAVIIELKQRSQYLARAVTRLLRERKLERRAIVLSFYWRLLRTVKELSPDTLTLAAFGVRAALFRLALRLPYADGLGARASLLSARVRRSCLNRRKFLAAWSVNDEDKLHRLLRNKAADLIVTDRPRAILSLLENLKSSSHGAHGRAGDAPGPSAVDSHHGPT
jgi:glycerophosphoryl diester phosphodiesterase